MAAKTGSHRYGTKLRHCHPVHNVTTQKTIPVNIASRCGAVGEMRNASSTTVFIPDPRPAVIGRNVSRSLSERRMPDRNNYCQSHRCHRSTIDNGIFLTAKTYNLPIAACDLAYMRYCTSGIPVLISAKSGGRKLPNEGEGV